MKYDESWWGMSIIIVIVVLVVGENNTYDKNDEGEDEACPCAFSRFKKRFGRGSWALEVAWKLYEV